MPKSQNCCPVYSDFIQANYPMRLVLELENLAICICGLALDPKRDSINSDCFAASPGGDRSGRDEAEAAGQGNDIFRSKLSAIILDPAVEYSSFDVKASNYGHFQLLRSYIQRMDCHISA